MILADTPNEISGATVLLTDSQFNILGYDTTDSNGDYGFSAKLSGHTPYTLSVTKTRFDTDYKGVSGGGENDFNLEGTGKKIAVFFWASDAGVQYAISKYFDILVNDEDYDEDESKEYKDSSNVASDCQEVDDYEIYADTIFVYIIGHGYNDGSHSYTSFKDGENASLVGSHTFNGYMDDWEAERKCILVDSCYSGDWADDFDEIPYLAMSSSNEYNLSYIYDSQYAVGASPGEGEFSFHFFYAIEHKDYNAVDAFDYASGKLRYEQNPKIEDDSTYEWFD
jgi:hypothetical protein